MKLASNAAARLFEARERLGWSRAEVARRSKAAGYPITESTVYNIERGVSKRPYPRTIYALAEMYGIDASELFEDAA